MSTSASALWGGATAGGGGRAALPSHVDVAIVGAGLTGLSAAYHLLREGPELSVAVLDAHAPGHGASGRTTGMVTPGIGQDFARLLGRVGSARAADAYRLTREAVDDVAALVTDERIDCEHRVTGQLVVAHGREGSRRIATQAEAPARAAQPHALLDRAALEERVSLRFVPAGASPAAYFVPNAATVHPVKLVEGLALAVRARGGHVAFPAEVRSIDSGNEVTVHLACGARVTASNVILATGGYAPGLSGHTGRILPLTLTVAATQPLEAAQRERIGWAAGECIIDSRRLFSYFRLTSDHRIVFGGGLPLWGAMPALPGAFDPLERELRAAFEGGERFRISHRWSGTIDYTLDALPVMANVEGRENVLYAGGFCGHGIALGIRAGRWLAGRVLHRHTAPFFPWLRDKPAWIPGEWVRKHCFAAASGWMRVRDA
jgi:gamma-glutamylputrescine oxidase